MWCKDFRALRSYPGAHHVHCKRENPPRLRASPPSQFWGSIAERCFTPGLQKLSSLALEGFVYCFLSLRGGNTGLEASAALWIISISTHMPQTHLTKRHNAQCKHSHLTLVKYNCTLLSNNWSGFLKVNKETIQQRNKNFCHVRDHHHLRLSQAAFYIEEVKDLVISDKTNSNCWGFFLLFSVRKIKPN